MVTLAISVEGLTEVLFAEIVLAPHLALYNKKLAVYNLGGSVSLPRIEKDLNRLVSHGRYVTTLYDYYGFHGIDRRFGKIKLEEKIRNVVAKNRRRQIIPYVQMHEFEGLLFSSPCHLASGTGRRDIRNKEEWAQNILNSFHGNPEAINNSKKTAPSKRLHAVGYSKTIHGAAIAKRITIPTLRKMCAGFDNWIRQLENLK